MIENRALTTFETVRDELGLSGTSDQTALERYIMRATDKIEELCNRRFARADGVVERVRALGDLYLYVSRYPVLDVDSITFVDGTEADDSWYDWESRKADGMIQMRVPPYRRSALADPISGEIVSGSEWYDYRVTYSAGWMTPLQAANSDPEAGDRALPYDLEDVCVRLVVFYWRQRGRDPGVRSVSVGSGSVSYADRVEGVPSDLYGDIMRYARTAVA